MEIPDLTNLPIESVLGLALVIALVDVAGSVVLAIAHRDFSASYLGDYLRTHVLLRVTPITLLGIAGHGIGPAVSKRIVEALGGQLEVQQSQREVSFVLRLPPAL